MVSKALSQLASLPFWPCPSHQLSPKSDFLQEPSLNSLTRSNPHCSFPSTLKFLKTQWGHKLIDSYLDPRNASTRLESAGGPGPPIIRGWWTYSSPPRDHSRGDPVPQRALVPGVLTDCPLEYEGTEISLGPIRIIPFPAPLRLKCFHLALKKLYTYIYIYTHTCIYIYIYTYIYIYIHAHTHTHDS